MADDALILTTRKPKHQGGKKDTRVPTLTVLYHPDWRRVGDCVRLLDLFGVGSACLSRLAPDFADPRGERKPAPLADPFVSRKPAVIKPRGDGGVSITLGAGTEIFANGTPIRDQRSFSVRELELGVVLCLAERVVLLAHTTDATRPTNNEDDYGLVGQSDAMTKLRKDIGRVAELDVAVLLRGETGVGKELVARAIHNTSEVASAPCVCVNMAAVPASVAASAMFGHDKGAFTGAGQKHEGYFSQASGGTLFLDEIGETPREIQPMLLRALETLEIQPLGDTKTQKLKVRLIAATDLDLEEAISLGSFRQALFHRLSGYQIHITPLRERREDIGSLLVHFLSAELRAVGDDQKIGGDPSVEEPWLPAAMVDKLTRHDWPGNARQLRNVARQLVISSRGEAQAQVDKSVGALLDEVESTEPEPAPNLPPRVGGNQSPSEISDDGLVAALRQNRWRTTATAAQLGISRTSLYKLIDKSKRLRKARDLSREELQAAHKTCNGSLDEMSTRLEVSKRGLQLRMKRLGLL